MVDRLGFDDQRFALGHITMTRGVAVSFSAEELPQVYALLRRHARGDWGEVDSHDARVNIEALDHGGRIFSRYTIQGCPLYIITEHDRSVTTILWASEY